MANWYEEKQEAKRERLRERAAKKAAEAQRLSDKGWDALKQIPFGQPILVGHHSEKADRAYRGRAVGNIDKSVVVNKEADELADRAERVGTGGISSDDPDAIEKLERKLLNLQEGHAIMIMRNKEARAEEQKAPFPAYSLSNNNNNIRSVKQRIEQLQKIKTIEPKTASGNGWMMKDDIDENRIMFVFANIPNEETRALLKSHAFLWSPSRKAWVRKITPNARYSTQRIIEKL